MTEIYRGVDSFLAQTSRKTIHFCVSNAGNAVMAANLACSAKIAGIPLTHFSLDSRGIELVLPFCDIVDISEEKARFNLCGSGTAAQVDFRTAAFASVAWQRYAIINTLLENGRNAICLDTDIAINSNYEKEILSMLGETDCDIIAQANHANAPCTGFLAIPGRTQKLFSKIYNHQNIAAHGYIHGYKNLGDASDQSFFHEVVYPGNKESGPAAETQLLAKDSYPNGQWFYDQHEAIKDTARLIHFNCIIGQEAKIARMKLHGKWLIGE
jgi:hypothetical protein